MTAIEATKQDWEDLRDRVESKTGLKMDREQEKRTGWAGENDPELWVNIVGEKQRQKKHQQEIDQAIRAANSRSFAARGRTEKETPDDNDYFRSAMAFFFLAGMIVGAAVLLLAQYFL